MFFIADIRDGKMWTWSGSKFRPAERHEAKGYKSERVAMTRAARLVSSGYAVGETVVRQNKAIEND